MASIFMRFQLLCRGEHLVHVHPGLIADGLDLFDEGVAVGDERLETLLVIRAGAMRRQQKVIVGKVKRRFLIALLVFGDVPASVAADLPAETPVP